MDRDWLQDMMQISFEPLIFHFYDSWNPLHNDFHSHNSKPIQQFKRESGVKVVSIDLDSISDPLSDRWIKLATGKSIE